MADVTLPQLGETVTEGTITQWFKQVGDTVAADEALFEVSTDKVDTEVPSPVAGTLTEIRVQEGETVEVGTVIAVVGDGAAAGGRGSRPPRRRRPRKPAAEEAPAPEPAGATEAPAVEDGAGASRRPSSPPSRGRRRPPPSRPRQPSSPPQRAVGGQGHPAVAGRAAAGQRARPRPVGDHRHRSRRADHARRRARPHRQDGQQAGTAPASTAAPAAPAAKAAPPPRRPRSRQPRLRPQRRR